MRANEFISEGKTVYHGDDYNTISLSPSLMNNGNNQEGIGIYFAEDKDTTKSYGKNVIAAEIDISKFVPSREPASDVIQVKQLDQLLRSLWDYENEDLFYWISDWFMVSEPEDVRPYHVSELASKIINDQVRNLQVELADKFGTEPMVEAWNKFIRIDGTYHPNREGDMWYAIINPEIQVRKVG